jgi:hypothetical protein
MASINTEDQIAAWDRYAEAKRRADRTLKIEDGLEAIRAWKIFANVSLPKDRDFPLDPEPRALITFPVHKTRPPGGL